MKWSDGPLFPVSLVLHPNNGWALKGLAACYYMTEQHQQAIIAEKLFEESWIRSDITLEAACFCSKGNEM